MHDTAGAELAARTLGHTLRRVMDDWMHQARATAKKSREEAAERQWADKQASMVKMLTAQHDEKLADARREGDTRAMELQSEVMRLLAEADTLKV